MPLSKKEKKNCFGNCGNAIADNVKIYIYIYIYFDNYGNPIAENGKKKFVLAIVAMRLPKMEKKIMKYVNE